MKVTTHSLPHKKQENDSLSFSLNKAKLKTKIKRPQKKNSISANLKFCLCTRLETLSFSRHLHLNFLKSEILKLSLQLLLICCASKFRLFSRSGLALNTFIFVLSSHTFSFSPSTCKLVKFWLILAMVFYFYRVKHLTLHLHR